MKLRLLTILSLVLVLAGSVSVQNSYATSSSSSTCCGSGCCFTTHVVNQGEYLKLIAARYGTTVDAILCNNNIRNPNIIYPGQRLKIPVTCGGGSPSGVWQGKWWSNRDMSGTPKLTHNYNSIDFNWGTRAVGSGVGSDNFSARFTSTIKFAAANYRFHVLVDDGTRLFIDGQAVIDQWHDSSATEYTADKQMAAGNHTLRLDYYEHSGQARIKFWMEQVTTPPTTLWTAEYFNNTTLTPPPVLIRSESHAIDYDWGTGSPVADVHSDNFSVRWVRNVTFQEGTYRFTAFADDGVVVRIDGTPIIDQWHVASGETYVKDVHLTAGVHEVRVRYYEATGSAKIKVTWTKLGTTAPWTAKYFNNKDLSGDPKLTRTENAINHDFGSGSPAPAIAADNFSAQWDGDFTFAAGTYRFTATVDDGIRVYLDNVLLIDEWHITSARTYFAELFVPAGTHHVKVQYFENTGQAVVKVSWVKK